MRLLVLFIWISSASAFANDEVAERTDLMNQAALLFAEERFSELEQLAADNRGDDIRTSSGVVRYPFIYEGIQLETYEFDKDDVDAWNMHYARIDSWIRQFPRSALAVNSKGMAIANRGQAYRGGAYIGKTPKPDLDRAYALLIEAVEYFMTNEELGRSEPRWFKELLDAFTTLGVDDVRYDQVLLDAIEAHPNHDPFYFIATRNYSPQWGGSSKAIDDLARLAMRQTKSERGYEMYARVYWAAPQLTDGSRHLMKDEINWDYFLLGVDAVLDKYPVQWNIQNFAMFTCLRRDFEKTSELLAMMEMPIIQRAWYGDENYLICRSHAARWQKSQYLPDSADRAP